MWTFLTPQLPVADVVRAQRYYADVLGFEIPWGREDYGAVTNGTTEIFLIRAPEPRARAVCCVRVPDADALYALYRERGANIVEPIASRPWGMREFTLEDPDGHRFRIGHALPRMVATFR
jgi:uncharacterized glyoxalase superfamily protein PhnB